MSKIKRKKHFFKKSFRIENDCGSVCTGLNFQGLSYNSNCRFGIKLMNFTQTKKPPLQQWKQWSKRKLWEEWNSAPGCWRSAGLFFKLFNLIYKLTSLWIALPASCMTLWQRQRNREIRVLSQETGAGTQALSSWQSFRLPSHNTVQHCANHQNTWFHRNDSGWTPSEVKAAYF